MGNILNEDKEHNEKSIRIKNNDSVKVNNDWTAI